MRLPTCVFLGFHGVALSSGVFIRLGLQVPLYTSYYDSCPYQDSKSVSMSSGSRIPYITAEGVGLRTRPRPALGFGQIFYAKGEETVANTPAFWDTDPKTFKTRAKTLRR